MLGSCLGWKEAHALSSTADELQKYVADIARDLQDAPTKRQRVAKQWGRARTTPLQSTSVMPTTSKHNVSVEATAVTTCTGTQTITAPCVITKAHTSMSPRRANANPPVAQHNNHRHTIQLMRTKQDTEMHKRSTPRTRYHDDDMPKCTPVPPPPPHNRSTRRQSIARQPPPLAAAPLAEGHSRKAKRPTSTLTQRYPYTRQIPSSSSLAALRVQLMQMQRHALLTTNTCVDHAQRGITPNQQHRRGVVVKDTMIRTIKQKKNTCNDIGALLTNTRHHPRSTTTRVRHNNALQHTHALHGKLLLLVCRLFRVCTHSVHAPYM